MLAKLKMLTKLKYCNLYGLTGAFLSLCMCLLREPYSELNKLIIPIFMDELSLSGLFSSRCLGANSKLDTEVKQLTVQKVALEVKRFFFFPFHWIFVFICSLTLHVDFKCQKLFPPQVMTLLNVFAANIWNVNATNCETRWKNSVEWKHQLRSTSVFTTTLWKLRPATSCNERLTFHITNCCRSCIFIIWIPT